MFSRTINFAHDFNLRGNLENAKNLSLVILSINFMTIDVFTTLLILKSHGP